MHIAHNIEYPLIMLSHSTVLALDNTTPIPFLKRNSKYIRPKFPVTTV